MSAFEFWFEPQSSLPTGVAPLTVNPEFAKSYFKETATKRRIAVLTVIEQYPRVELHVHLKEEVVLVLAPLKGKSNGVTTAYFEGHYAPHVEWEDCWQASAVRAAVEPNGQKNVGEGIWWEAMKRSPEFRAWVAECFPGYWGIVKSSFEEPKQVKSSKATGQLPGMD